MATPACSGQQQSSRWRLCGSRLIALTLCLALPVLRPAGAKAPAPTESKNWDSRGADERDKLLKKYGGTKESEAAVALGLEWLALHQSSNGSWSLDQFHKYAHVKAGPEEKETTCDCAGQGQENAVAGTAFGLLPILGAGYTHQPGKEKDKVDYSKTVKAGLDFLVSKQKDDGDFGGGMYAQGLASIAVCEAYGMTADPKLKGPAQKTIDFIVSAQHDEGGWRYKPKERGDTSVTGWQVEALYAGKLAGLKVPKATLEGANIFLDSVFSEKDGGYGYTLPSAAPTTTSIGLLCRLNLGQSVNDKNARLSAEILRNYPPGALNSVYYYYHASQDMHYFGGEYWEEGWNPKMRDWLVEKQDKADDSRHAHQKGSWSPKDDAHGKQGGRVMQTSLSLLTLEVYYRYARAEDKAGDK